jgi:hypothetical protein
MLQFFMAFAASIGLYNAYMGWIFQEISLYRICCVHKIVHYCFVYDAMFMHGFDTQ